MRTFARKEIGFYERGIKKLPCGWAAVVENDGDYILSGKAQLFSEHHNIYIMFEVSTINIYIPMGGAFRN